MFERFAADARAVVVEAQQVARATNSSSIDAGHLLASIAGRPGSTAAQELTALGVDLDTLARTALPGVDLDAEALAAVGIDLAAVSERLDAVFGTGALDRAAGRVKATGHIPFTKEAKKVLELSLREAIYLGDKTICSEHMLLGITRMPESQANKALANALHQAGADIPTLRRSINTARRRNGGSGPTGVAVPA